MNAEQVEGQLSEFGGKFVSVSIPVRGTILQTYYGKLDIRSDLEDHMISYHVHFYPDADISFRAGDIHKIISNENPIDTGVEANIILKSDTWMEQLNSTGI